MSADRVSKLSNLSGVSQASGGLSLIAIHLEGTFPGLPSSGSSRPASPASR